MDRRSFLATLIGTVAFDSEKVLWVPGKRKFFIPSATDFIWINVEATRQTGVFSQQPTYDGLFVDPVGKAVPSIKWDVTRIPVSALDPVCRHAYEEDRQFWQQKHCEVRILGQMPFQETASLCPPPALPVSFSLFPSDDISARIRLWRGSEKRFGFYRKSGGKNESSLLFERSDRHRRVRS